MLPWGGALMVLLAVALALRVLVTISVTVLVAISQARSAADNVPERRDWVGKIV